MAHRFPSEEWIQAWQEAVNDDEVYGERAAGWGVDFDGDMLFHLQADDRLPEDRYFFVGLEDGAAHDCHAVEDPEAVDYGFVLRGTYTDWVRMTSGEVGAIDGLMSGVFELGGDMQKVLRFSDAAARLVDLAATVDSDYAY
ncbi:SCP2 sterol-binding domain-containing protein [Halomarina litorea]|uniref:SCP2 sterol-binding domain-containing protein n=1 Tax=Halomarina litorea TaxID=2961595 RepID=UPI0020C318A3|nr:SCP2 sterol-binding domain-containing protein [Halomarina sp. BCD28]